jgi:hypothetical protein
VLKERREVEERTGKRRERCGKNFFINESNIYFITCGLEIVDYTFQFENNYNLFLSGLKKYL